MMARFPRVVALDTPHHITQRGNGRRFILDSDSDRRVYLDLLLHHCQLHELSLVGYCLMSNHVHLIAVPQRPDSLALALKHTHGRFASFHNTRHVSSGHLWQGRFYSCPLDRSHLWPALRYVELNPVRAGMATDASSYPWSSASTHCGLLRHNPLLDLSSWQAAWAPFSWNEYLAAAVPAGEHEALRRNTHTGRPLGSKEFISQLESPLGRRLEPDKGGRPRKDAASEVPNQITLENASAAYG